MVFKVIGENHPEIWNHETEGMFIEGVYIRKDIEVGKNKSNVYILEVGGIEKSIWGSTVLDDKMEQVTIGDLIRVTYLGKDATKGYKKYRIERDEPDNN